jgi:hypothetical protein
LTDRVDANEKNTGAKDEPTEGQIKRQVRGTAFERQEEREEPDDDEQSSKNERVSVVL